MYLQSWNIMFSDAESHPYFHSTYPNPTPVSPQQLLLTVLWGWEKAAVRWFGDVAPEPKNECNGVMCSLRPAPLTPSHHNTRMDCHCNRVDSL